MKPDWDALGEKYEDSKKVIIGDVDCTVHTELCSKHGVEGYPTLKVFNPPDTEGEVYDGGRDLKTLKKYVKTLGPKCTVSTWEDHCTEKQKAALQPYIDMPPSELISKMTELKMELKAVETVHQSLVESLQKQFEASQKMLEDKGKEINPTLKLMRNALKQEDLELVRQAIVEREAQEQGASKPKDEV